MGQNGSLETDLYQHNQLIFDKEGKATLRTGGYLGI
jgi:hypothetical protein